MASKGYRAKLGDINVKDSNLGWLASNGSNNGAFTSLVATNVDTTDVQSTACKVSDTSIASIYQHDTSKDIILTIHSVSGNVISNGTPVTVVGAAEDVAIAADYIMDNKILIAVKFDTIDDINLYTYTVSGTVPSLDASATDVVNGDADTTTEYPMAVAVCSSSRAILLYRTVTDQYPKERGIQIGSGSLSVDAAATVLKSSANYSGNLAACKIDSTHILAGYTGGSASNTLGRVITMNATTTTANTEAALSNRYASADHLLGAAVNDSGTLGMVLGTPSINNIQRFGIFGLSGTSITAPALYGFIAPIEPFAANTSLSGNITFIEQIGEYSYFCALLSDITSNKKVPCFFAVNAVDQVIIGGKFPTLTGFSGALSIPTHVIKLNGSKLVAVTINSSTLYGIVLVK